jgi:2-keto-4-pentenoate hydratase/2-oxohepta-3-ene-1,7-dioic acid hydratase in catechol pathway
VRLCRFAGDGGPRLGLLDGDRVLDLSAVAPDLPPEPARALEAAGGAEALAGTADAAEPMALGEVRLLSPARPRKYLAIALNYADHIAESGLDAPKVPTFFNKQATCVVGTGADVHMPKVSDKLDYEGELAVVIGRRCRHVSAEQAREAIAGYTIANDVSVRDWQLRTPTMTMGKSFDTHGPLGPWVVTADELGDPHALDIKTYVNGEVRQDGNTGEMIFNCFQQVAHLSEAFTLEPGDVIATGTPAGIGAVRQPFPEGLLKVGDTVRVEIDGIGALENTVIEEPEGFVVLESEEAPAWVS